MNFLAHAALSPSNNQVLVGNFFGDSFKGKPEKFGPEGLVTGIRLHREIDRFTDTHPLVHETIKLFREEQGRLAPALVDMVFDYLLASDFQAWSEQGLVKFSNSVYDRLDHHEHLIPDSALRFYPHMRRHNALLRYGSIDGLKTALERMDDRLSMPSNMAQSTDFVESNKPELIDLFSEFFMDLIDHTNHYLDGVEAEIGSRRVPLKK